MFNVIFFVPDSINDEEGQALYTAEDLGLVLAKKTISAPAVKTHHISVPGADGVLDYTDYFGYPTYENRAITMEFIGIMPYEAHLTRYQKLSRVHGQRLGVCFGDELNGTDADSKWYYVGRVSVGDYTYDRGALRVTVAVDADPYKIKFDEEGRTRTTTSGTWSAIGLGVDPLVDTLFGRFPYGGRKPFRPVFNTNGVAFQYSFTLSTNGTTYTGTFAATEDDQIIDDLIVYEREIISVRQSTGESADIVVKWRDEAL